MFVVSRNMADGEEAFVSGGGEIPL
ncbi:hypothetical protein MAR_009934 [Mya arenaria]|uniref:Uncharacterized protein n=1 Tax=Mya arenaria TaxID=6604 RepID=A0ABY7E4D3_MYAAR|nr:hypothetical protein MAR_009934 [Mya arenaria]